VTKATLTKSGKRTRAQRRRDREREQTRQVDARVIPADDTVREDVHPDATTTDRPAAATAAVVAVPREDAPAGLVEKLFGGGQRVEEPETGVVHYQKKPGLLRPLARRNYQRDAALTSIRRGFEDLSHLMADIRDGLHDSVDRQGDLLEQMKYLPVVAEQNAKSAERFEEQFRQNNQQLARSNDLADQNLRVQGESLKQQAESVKALRDQILGQRDQAERLDKLLVGFGKEARDQKRDVDDMQGRLDRMRQSDQAIADNLGTVAGAIRRVNEQAAVQGELVAKLQSAMDERTHRLEAEVVRRGKTQGVLIWLTLLLAFGSMGAVAAAAVVYLRQTGGM
jgi:DNA repair exonuclease SbcCD ATPase subunit